MTELDQYRPTAPSVRTRISQATAVEQSRAVAEVQAAVLVAQNNHRDKTYAITEMRDTTAQQSVAEKAFFRFTRAGSTVTGPTIHLARELARCWGNIQYGINELKRDDTAGESEMQAFAWDLETNARSVSSFIVPHVRYSRDKGRTKLEDPRDVYENNANNGARRVRECIFAVLPSWYIDEAKDRCNATLREGGGVPLQQRIANCIDSFRAIGVSKAQLEAKLGSESGEWTDHEVAELGVIFKSIDRGEMDKGEEFPAQSERRSVAEVLATPTPDPAPEAEPKVAMSTLAQQKKLAILLGEAGVTDRAEKLDYLREQFGRTFTTSKELTKDEASRIIQFLETSGQPDESQQELPTEEPS